MSRRPANPQPMRLTAFRHQDVEVVDGGFRYRHGLRAFLARLRARWDAAWAKANPELFERPSDRA